MSSPTTLVQQIFPRRTTKGTALEPLSHLRSCTTLSTLKTTGLFLQTQATFLLVVLLQFPKTQLSHPCFSELIALIKQCAASALTCPSPALVASVHAKLHTLLKAGDPFSRVTATEADNSESMAAQRHYIHNIVVPSLRSTEEKEKLTEEWIDHAVLLMVAKERAHDLKWELREQAQAEREKDEAEKAEREEQAKEELARLQHIAEQRISEVPSVLVTGPNEEHVEYVERDRFFVIQGTEGGSGDVEVGGKIEVEPELGRRIGGLRRGSRILLEGWGIPGEDLDEEK